MLYDQIDCPELDVIDSLPSIKVERLISICENIQEKYGYNAELVFDAGYNNISVNIFPSRKQKDQSKKVKVIQATKDKIIKAKPKRGMTLVQLKYNAPHVGRYT